LAANLGILLAGRTLGPVALNLVLRAGEILAVAAGLV
jgi:hypothetical protein